MQPVHVVDSDSEAVSSNDELTLDAQGKGQPEDEVQSMGNSGSTVDEHAAAVAAAAAAVAHADALQKTLRDVERKMQEVARYTPPPSSDGAHPSPVEGPKTNQSSRKRPADNTVPENKTKTKRTKMTKPTAEPKVSIPAVDAESEHEDPALAKKKRKKMRKKNGAKMTKPTAGSKISIPPAADTESEYEKRRSEVIAANKVVLAGLLAPPPYGEVLPDSLPLASKTQEYIGVDDVISVRALASWEACTGLAGGFYAAKVVKVGYKAGKHPELSALSVVVQYDNVMLSYGPRETKAQGLLPTRSSNGTDWALLTRAPELGRGSRCGSSRGGRLTK